MIKKTRATSPSKKRCQWAGTDPRMVLYHDRVWGKPKKKDRDIFEALVLDTNQAGLSWACILYKRDNFARAFHNFDAHKVARMTKRDVARLMKDAGIIRHRGKIEATLENARLFCELEKEWGSAARYFWSFAPEKKKSAPRDTHSVPACSLEGDALSHDMKKRGFRFCGPTVCYAFMQGIGIVDDHTRTCFLGRKG